MNKRNFYRFSIIILLLIILLAGYFIYSAFISPTSIAFVNYPDYMYAGFCSSNKNSFINTERIDWKAGENPDLSGYDAIYIFGMGLHPSPEQKKKLNKAIAGGLGVYVNASTKSETDITTLIGKDLEYVQSCLANGGKENYRRLLNYTRRKIDGKKLFSEPVSEPVKIPFDCFFHIAEASFFESYREYLDYYKKNKLYKKGAPKVCFLTTNAGPSNAKREHVNDIIRALESRQLNVFPICGFRKRMEFIKKAGPDMLILMPHGRLSTGNSNEAVNYLKDKNIPLLCPVNMFAPYEEWEKDQRGMSGGIMSQSIVMPELDGGIAPYVLTAQFKNSRGLYEFRALPGRLEKFSSFVEKFLALRKKANKDKKIVVVYYKGPGSNALNAAGLEVGESLLNVFGELKKAGYHTGKLPENTEELLKLIQKNASLYADYARGSEEKFLKESNPELVPVKKYLEWCKKAIPADLYSRVEEKYGPAPGKYMSIKKDGKDFLALGRLRFGNVVLMPQSLPGYGDNASKLIHGTKQVPPHPYICTYLWAKYGYETDALIHFGTHGSLEFTPWKQLALSDHDWPDILMGGIPHFYIYTINNIGEAVIAKRRSYAEMITHLTPPFMSSGLYAELNQLHEKIHIRNSTEDKTLQSEYEKSILKLIKKLKLDQDLELEDLKPENASLPEGVLEKIHNYLHEIENAKINRGIYVLGRRYSDKEAKETARLMCIDAIASCGAEIDIQKGNITQQQREDLHFYEENYLRPAEKKVAAVFEGRDPEKFMDRSDLDNLKKFEKENPAKGDMNLMAAMMGMRANAEEDKEKEKKSRGKNFEKKHLKFLLLRISASPEKLNFVKSLKDAKKFEKFSTLANPRNLKRAKQVAALVPQMREPVKMASDNDISALVKLMRSTDGKEYIFKLLDDPEVRKKIIAEQKAREISTVKRCTSEESLKTLLLALDIRKSEEFFTSEDISNMDALKEKIDAIEEFRKRLQFLIKHKNLAGNIRDFESPHATTVYKILTGSPDTLKKRIAESGRALRKARARYADYIQSVKRMKQALDNVKNYYNDLKNSTSAESEALLNALNGGYISASSGGDPVVNPSSVPTGKNLYAIDAERTPTKEAWETAKKLADAMINQKLNRKKQYPKKVAFSLWGGEFIRGRGVNIAEILYLLGVKPDWDSRGRVKDVKLIPMEELKRPRIDVVVQTSGQFRCAATSRIYLIDKAVRLAANAGDEGEYENFVREGNTAAEKLLIEKGFSPLEARSLSAARVFGGINGNYGTGIMGLVESGDKWEKDEEIADSYLHNMGAVYSNDNWCAFHPGLFEAAIQNTDTVVHPRSSNTSGPLSLDHVYEFMGGMNMAVRNITGKDPDAYFNDLRNPNRARVQNAREAAMTEARTTILNPKYIKEMFEEGPSAAETFAETFRNTYGWEVMKPEMLDDNLWEDMKKVYVDDRYKLSVREFFEKKNPYALQEMTAVMLETIRKGYWKADEATKTQIAELHVELIKKHKPGCSGFVCDNSKLQNMISGLIKKPDLKKQYNNAIEKIRSASGSAEKVKGMHLEKQSPLEKTPAEMIRENLFAVSAVSAIILLLFLSVIWGVRSSK